MLPIPFPLDCRKNLLKNIEIQMPSGEDFTVNCGCENSSKKNSKSSLRTFPVGQNDTTLVFNNTVPII